MDTFDDRLDTMDTSLSTEPDLMQKVRRTCCLNRRRIFFMDVIPMMRNIYVVHDLVGWNCQHFCMQFRSLWQLFVSDPGCWEKNKTCCEKTSAWLDLKTFGNMAGNMVEFHSEMFQTVPPWRYPISHGKLMGWKMRYSLLKRVPLLSQTWLMFRGGWAYNSLGNIKSYQPHWEATQKGAAWWMSTTSYAWIHGTHGMYP